MKYFLFEEVYFLSQRKLQSTQHRKPRQDIINFIKEIQPKARVSGKEKCSVKYELLEKVTSEKDFSLQRMR